MPSAKRSRPNLPLPKISEASQELCLESTLAELPLHNFQVEAHHCGRDVAEIFERFPLLPGVVLREKKQFLGMISRQRLLEFLIRPQGMELFMPQPLSVLHSYARTNSLIVPEATPILIAAQFALRRSPAQQSEPIVVQSHPDSYALLDVHELNIAYWQIRGIETQVRYERTQAQMIQTEKMASLGRLVDGVAHEILDPVGFIWGNLVHLTTYLDQVMTLLAAYEAHFPRVPEAIARLQTDIELDYLKQDLPPTLTSIRSGAERLKKLATSLQNFCHVDEVYPKPTNLHECLDSLLLLLKSRLTGEICFVRNYGHLPPVPCFAGQLNQVFMNILTNSIEMLLNQAIRQELADEFGSEPGLQQLSVVPPQITITTQVRSLSADSGSSSSSRWISICIANNGSGLSPERQQQILESFSVEKRAAKETSLAVSYQIVTAKHGGKFQVRSPITPSGGTEFEILLPLV
ncbi:MAG: sensor histidine kinase [Cyanobacteria bacterium CRU_2_1]|nr:sensor histidine kinase [Cyanobacteria bacterium CRU_2_1]